MNEVNSDLQVLVQLLAGLALLVQIGGVEVERLVLSGLIPTEALQQLQKKLDYTLTLNTLPCATR